MTKETFSKNDRSRKTSCKKRYDIRKYAKRRTNHRLERKLIKDSSIKNALFDLRHVIASGSQEPFIDSSDKDLISEEDVVIAAIERIRQLESELTRTTSDSGPTQCNQFSSSMQEDKHSSIISRLAKPPPCAKKVKRMISKLGDGNSKSRKTLNFDSFKVEEKMIDPSDELNNALESYLLLG